MKQKACEVGGLAINEGGENKELLLERKRTKCE